jgi:hypothetical protein
MMHHINAVRLDAGSSPEFTRGDPPRPHGLRGDGAYGGVLGRPV